MKRNDKSMFVMFLAIVIVAAVAFVFGAGAKEGTVTGKVSPEGTVIPDSGQVSEDSTAEKPEWQHPFEGWPYVVYP
jgi:hypothetical protein